MRVEIFNELKKTEGIVTVHGNNGAMIYTTPIINGSASLDISSCPNGLYILHVKIGDSVSSWKITAVPFRNLPVRIGSAYSNRLTLSREQSC